MFYHIKGKGTAVPVQSMKAYRRSRDIAPAIFRHVPIAARSVSWLHHVCLSLSTCISVASSGHIFTKFHIRDFYKSLSKNSTFGQNFTKRSGTLHKDLSVFHTTGATIQSTHRCASMATLSTFITPFTATYYVKIQMEHTVSLPWQNRLHKCTRKLRYTYNSYHVHLGIRWSRDFVICIKSCPCTIPCICTWRHNTRWT